MVDHLVYATPDLRGTVADLGRKFGMQLSEGGQHLGFGTRNYLAHLGGRCYLEVVGPDWEQPAPPGPRLFGVDSLPRPCLSTFALCADDLDLVALRVRNAGFSLGPIRSMSRASADGVGIRWRMTPPMYDPRFGRLLPFVVEWGDSPHPADRAARGCTLTHLAVHTRDVGELGARLTVLGADVPVVQRDTSGLVAVLDTPAGRVVLD